MPICTKTTVVLYTILFWSNLLIIGALVDRRILCVHGGIPSLDVKSDFFQLVSQIPCPLRDPENESPLAWELLWNDPLSDDMRDLDNTNDGFISNIRRGTGFFFSSKALNDFLNQNLLSYVVRAHEVQQQGFKVSLSAIYIYDHVLNSLVRFNLMVDY